MFSDNIVFVEDLMRKFNVHQILERSDIRINMIEINIFHKHISDWHLENSSKSHMYFDEFLHVLFL